MTASILVFASALLIGCSSGNNNEKTNEIFLKDSIEKDKVTTLDRKALLNVDSSVRLANLSFFCLAFSPVNVSNYSSAEVRKLYKDLLLQDQQYRDSLHVPVKNEKEMGERNERFEKSYKKADSLNQLILSAAVSKFGWPTTEKYGIESVKAAFLITWHADAPYKKQYLDLFEQAAKSDTLNFHYYKILKDRVLLSEWKKQQYNTHKFLSNGAYHIDF